ncbi:hypothetical protein [Enterobacter hormaechei]|uniref:hypothetical protein n=1 Tax=Enterobacter hormaechei TaxID=158836 RepID=UPI003F42E153
MSTITRELAKLFRKITNSEIDAEGNAHVVLSPADSLLINNARIALASLEAEAVGEVIEQQSGMMMDGLVISEKPTYRNIKGIHKMKMMPLGTKFYTAPPAPANAEPVAWLWSHRKHPREVTLVRPEDDEKAEAALWSGWSCQALYASPPAPISVPAAMEMDDDFDSAFEHGKAVGWNAYRAAMLQSFGNSEQLNSPVIQDGWVMVPVEPTEDMIVNGFESEPDESFSDEKEWEAYEAMSGCQQAAHRAKLCWAAMIAAAPKLE